MNAAPLWAWMNERHRIYLRRATGDPWPWTDDPVLRTYRFCNVYRELDTVTVWIREHIREPYADYPHLWFLLCAARIYNLPGMLDAALRSGALPTALGATYNPDRLLEAVQARRGQGLRRYNSAYMMSADKRGSLLPGQPAWASPKDYMYAHLVLAPLWRKRVEARRALEVGTTEAFCAWLRSQYRFGGFLAYEVACDLHYTRWLSAAPDRDTWAHTGPGAVRGLNRLLGREVSAHMAEPEALDLMRDLLYEARETIVLGDHLPHPIHLREIEHSLCETHKYLKAKDGFRLKNLYRAPVPA